MKRSDWKRPGTSWKALLALSIGVTAAAPLAVAQPAEAIGRPDSLVVEPAVVVLHGPRAQQQLVVTGHYPDGSVRDLTSWCTSAADTPGIVEVVADGLLMPLGDGSTILRIQAGGVSAAVRATVRSYTERRSVSFRQEVMPVLTVAGCNAGICHGAPHGKNGFHLSLRGCDPDADYRELTRDALGRRLNRLAPEASLVLLKAVGAVPHEGGQRFARGSLPARLLSSWLADGFPRDGSNPAEVRRITVLPGARILRSVPEPARRQQLAILAHGTDGRVWDVTRLSTFNSSDSSIADVTATGLVRFSQVGEVAVVCRYLGHYQSLRLACVEPPPGFRWIAPPENNEVDRHVFAKLKTLNIAPSDLCSDQEFLRRAYLDLCGILPAPEAVTKFLSATDLHKRAHLIDELLQRPEYADFWTLKWGDVLRISRDTHRLRGVVLYQQWLRRQIHDNTPFDKVVRELLTASGNTFANAPANYFRLGPDTGKLKPEERREQLTEITAQVFCGIRIQCAKCHNHPLERWTQDDFYGLMAFFAPVRARADPDQPPAPAGSKWRNLGAEIIDLDRSSVVRHPRTQQAVPPRFLGGSVAYLRAGTDPRRVLANWLTSSRNPFFARATVNRIWFHLNGRGIIEPLDDFRDSNPAANDDLLHFLAEDLVVHRYDVKHLIRTIMNSRTYQLSSRTNDFNKGDSKYFSHALVKQHTAEQLLDAIGAATEVPEKFADPGLNLPAGTRAVQLPDAALRHPFLQAFHKPARQMACECEREADSSLPQALQLVNGRTINRKLTAADNRIGRLLARQVAPADMLRELYLATLSRQPSEAEARELLAYVSRSSEARRAWENVQRSLLNSSEFLFRH